MKLKKTFLICTFVLASMQLHASELTRYFDKLNSFQATFIQTIFSANNDAKKYSKGLIVVKSPNKFLLKYVKPFKLLYVADGKKLWSYDEDLEQIVVKEQGDLLINSPAMLLSDAKNLTKSYRIEKTGVVNGWLWFELTPKQENSNFETVSLAFENNELIAMEMRDNFGQTTHLEFSNIIKNPKLAKHTFKFVPPKGVDVIGQ